MSIYEPRWYDLYFTGLPGDVEFYIDAALSAGGNVLELGCGTGRILLPIARSGIDVTGLDLNSDLLEILFKKLRSETEDVGSRVNIIEADFSEFSIGQCFDLIIIPYRSFQHLMTPTDQL